MNLGPIHDYRAALAAGDLDPDASQLRVVELLHMLHVRLQGYRPGVEKGGLRGLLRIGRPDPPPRGLYLFGGVGRGKSMLMDMFFAGAPVAAKRRVHFHAFMEEIHGAIHQHRQQVKLNGGDGDDPIPPVAAEVAVGATLLCFDEFQVTDVADAMILGRLFEQFFAHGMVMVLTTNSAPDDLYPGGLNRPLFEPFIALLKDRLDIHHLDGELDHRLGHLVAQPIYSHPLGPRARAAMNRAWSKATAGLEVGPQSLPLKGRSLDVALATRSAARFSFDDLCGKPLGAADFLALADRYDTIFVDDIPQFSADRRDEIRRLVILVDAVYEAGGLIVASAEVEPDLLVTAGPEAAKFARTASRLHEMASATYLAGIPLTGDRRQPAPGSP